MMDKDEKTLIRILAYFKEKAQMLEENNKQLLNNNLMLKKQLKNKIKQVENNE